MAGNYRVIIRATHVVGLNRAGGRIDLPPLAIDWCLERYETSGLQFIVRKGNNECTVVVQKPAGEEI